ncbi:MAG: Fimbrial protein [uncultured Thiotrichaceae bacterium]|uniref:Fimbrial protein n=1 Tax=uncultured Thiotrichaceae bacterium TaxID=298394 RepID=A0A6S6TDI5_9GAMM|nr:MAG: Fimbrial protein [uncultured Thiotrichaceae bacterium]
MKKNKNNGFTLIELMIVVAIIGILSAIAYPNYTRYVQESKRTDAMVAIMSAAQSQEKFFSQNLRYAFSQADLGISASSENDLYTVSISGLESDGSTVCIATSTSCMSYTITATAKSGASQYHDTNCRKMTYTNVGVKSAEDSDGNTSSVCWE